MSRPKEIYALVTLMAGAFGIYALTVLQPLDSLAAPTAVCAAEIGALAVVFSVSIVVRPWSVASLGRNHPCVLGALRARVRLPAVVRALSLLTFLVGSTVFAFWAAADVLGGYDGYDWSFAAHPYLPVIYYALGLNYIRWYDVGNEAFVFFVIGVSGLIVYMLGSGIGVSIKDSITLFAAPTLVAFELALWYCAPEDMSWHATDFLTIGGIADGGWRVFGGGGSYLVSNWLVLATALFLVASRVPWLELASSVRGRGRRDLDRREQGILVHAGPGARPIPTRNAFEGRRAAPPAGLISTSREAQVLDEITVGWVKKG